MSETPSYGSKNEAWRRKENAGIVDPDIKVEFNKNPQAQESGHYDDSLEHYNGEETKGERQLAQFKLAWNRLLDAEYNNFISSEIFGKELEAALDEFVKARVELEQVEPGLVDKMLDNIQHQYFEPAAEIPKQVLP